MSFAFTPYGEWMYRQRSNKPMPVSYAMKRCAGPCKRTRSVGQFAANDELCATCRRRA